jgi:hypothetical protein
LRRNKRENGSIRRMDKEGRRRTFEGKKENMEGGGDDH